jgi:D-alanyl-D-alanine carboxypeptidase
VGLGIWSVETPCGTVWGHEGGIPGYKSFAISDRDGTRSAVVTVLTELDDTIGAAFEAAVATAACRMLDSDPAVASGRSAS